MTEQMPPNRNESRIQALLKTIALQYEASQLALKLYAHGLNLHDFINQCLGSMELAHEELKALVGPDETMRLITKQMDSPEKTDELKQDEGNE